MPEIIGDAALWQNPLAAAADEYAKTPPAEGVLGVLKREAVEGPVGYLTRAAERGAYAGSSWFDRALMGTGGAEAAASSLPTEGFEPVQTPTISADEANRRFAPQGASITTTPLPEGLARVIGQQKAQEIERESVISRFEQNHGLIANFSTGMAGFLLDPLNVATTFMPGLGEEAIAARLGGGLAARIGARVVAGAATGAAQQVPLTALRYGLGTEEASDYGLRQAFGDIATNAAVAAIAHAGLGTLGEALRGRTPEPAAAPILRADAATSDTTMRTAVAQMAEGRPVDVEPVIDPTPERAAEAIAKEKALASAGAGQGVTPDEWREPTEQEKEASAEIAKDMQEAERAPAEPARGAQLPAEAPQAAPVLPTPQAAAAVAASAPARISASPFEKIPRQPTRLTTWLQQRGGVVDEGGDVRNIIGGSKGRPGLINSRGMPLDEAALLAQQEGYIPERDIRMLLDAIEEDLKVRPRYSERDRDAVEIYHRALAANDEIDRLAQEHEIETKGKTREQFFDAIAQKLGQEKADDEAERLAIEHENDLAAAERMAQEWAEARGEEWRPELEHGAPLNLEEMELAAGRGEAATGPAAGTGGPGRLEPAAADQAGLQAGARQGAGIAGPGGRGEAAGRPGAAGPGEPVDIDHELAAAEAEVRPELLLPEEHAALNASTQRIANADRIAATYEAAGACLGRWA